MRYGRTLQLAIYRPWRDNYIDYTKLKQLLREDESAPSSPSAETPDQWTDEDESKFVDELVNVQLEKVHAFHQETYEKLRERTAKCEARLDGVAAGGQTDGAAESKAEDGRKNDGEGEGLLNGNGNGNSNGKKPVPSQDDQQKVLKEVLSELDQITREVNELEKYSRINYTGFLKAAKKHDRKRGGAYRVRPLLQVRLAALPFNKEDYSPLLYRLSAMYSFVRQHLDGAGESTGRGMSVSLDASQAQQGLGKEEYTSHKFWVHPDNLLELKTTIMRRLPVLVYNPQTSKIAEGNQRDPSITSIYFDNPAFKIYTSKVEQGEASSMRLRWYGQLNDKPEIYVEKKTVRDNDTSEDSRFVTKEKYVQRFLKGEYGMEKQIDKLSSRAGADSSEVKTLKSSVNEIQTFIKQNDLQPVLRANYTRTAFQIPGDDRVRISLDTDLAFIREDAIDTERPCRDPESWHRADIDAAEMEFPFSSIRKGEVSRFPFALLEIKVKNGVSGAKRNEWIAEIMHSHLVKEAPRFSKFVHGVAQLFEDYVNTFPFWLSEMEIDIRRDPQQAFEEEQAKRQKEADDEWAVGSLLKSQGGRSGVNSGAAVVSPVGSPANLSQSYNKSNRGKVATAEPTQTAETTAEPDEDETGIATSAPNGTAPKPSTGAGLKFLFPTFSTSKYATFRRAGHQGPLPAGVSRPENWIKDQGAVKVEAKVWLANQRTFIKWQHVSILLASLSLGLYNAAGVDNNIARALAVVYTVIAVAVAGWGYGIYIWRARMIERRSGVDFDAVTGPLVVCVGLIVALILNFGFKYQAVVGDRNPGENDLVLGGMVNETVGALRHWGDL